jgi:hypothetical protein
MDSYHRAQTLLEDLRYGALRSLRERKETSISHRRRGWRLFGNVLALALTLLSSAEVLAESLKLAYAALSAGQVASWMAKEGGYLSKYGIEGGLCLTSQFESG